MIIRIPATFQSLHIFLFHTEHSAFRITLSTQADIFNLGLSQLLSYCWVVTL